MKNKWTYICITNPKHVFDLKMLNAYNTALILKLDKYRKSLVNNTPLDQVKQTHGAWEFVLTAGLLSSDVNASTKTSNLQHKIKICCMADRLFEIFSIVLTSKDSSIQEQMALDAIAAARTVSVLTESLALKDPKINELLKRFEDDVLFELAWYWIDDNKVSVYRHFLHSRINGLIADITKQYPKIESLELSCHAFCNSFHDRYIIPWWMRTESTLIRQHGSWVQKLKYKIKMKLIKFLNK